MEKDLRSDRNRRRKQIEEPCHSSHLKQEALSATLNRGRFDLQADYCCRVENKATKKEAGDGQCLKKKVINPGDSLRR